MGRQIDADKLKAYLQDKYVMYDHTLADIDAQPTVDAESVKHGQWKPMDLTWGRSIYYCTNCGESVEVPTEKGKPIYMWCPFCGAKMDEEDKDAKIN